MPLVTRGGLALARAGWRLRIPQLLLQPAGCSRPVCVPRCALDTACVVAKSACFMLFSELPRRITIVVPSRL